MIPILIAAAIAIILMIIGRNEEDVNPGIILVSLALWLIMMMLVEINIPSEKSVFSEYQSLEKISDDYILTQNINKTFVVKYNNELQTLSFDNTSVMPSDSTYLEVMYEKQITYNEKREWWIPGIQENDTIIKFKKNIIHLKLL